MDLAYLGADLLTKVIRDVDGYREHKIIQEEINATYGKFVQITLSYMKRLTDFSLLAPKLTPSHFFLDFSSQSASTIYNLYRALGELGKLSAFWQDRNLRCRTRYRSLKCGFVYAMIVYENNFIFAEFALPTLFHQTTWLI
jgi:methionyl-tRNA formyltransferase